MGLGIISKSLKEKGLIGEEAQVERIPHGGGGFIVKREGAVKGDGLQ